MDDLYETKNMMDGEDEEGQRKYERLRGKKEKEVNAAVTSDREEWKDKTFCADPKMIDEYFT